MSDFVDAFGVVAELFVEGEVAVEDVVLFAQILLPVELVPSEVAAFFPIVF
jgi:hypothetical protein